MRPGIRNALFLSTRRLKVMLAAAVAAGALAATPASAVEIEYWQYVFDARVQAMDKLIAAFEAENPGITVKQVTFPYADYQTRVVGQRSPARVPMSCSCSMAGSTISLPAI
jgi:multiple sugar transport system substrate-binding protein